MPLYTYKCDEGHEVEELRPMWKMNEPVECKECGTLMTKVVSAANFILKGTGWARDGYQSKPKGNK